MQNPQQFFGRGGVLDLIGMRQSIPAGWGGTVQSPAAAVIAQGIANVFLANGMSELDIHQENNMTGWTKTPRLFVNLMLLGQLGD